MKEICKKCKKKLKEIRTENDKFCYRVFVNGVPYVGLKCKHIEKNNK